MGSCYSRQSQHQGKYSRPPEHPVKSSDNHSSDMPHPTTATEAGPEKARAMGTATQKGRHSGFGFRMPIVARYNNSKPNRQSTDQASSEEQNSTASNMSNGRGKKTEDSIREPLLKSANRRNKTRDKGRSLDNGFAASSESLTSLSSNGRSKGSKPSSKQSSLKRAYRPQGNTGSWKMIDDSSSAYSGKSGDKLLERNSRSQNTTPGLSLDDLSNGNTTASSTPVKMIPLIKAPIAVVESLETLSGGSKDDAMSNNRSPKKTSDDAQCGIKTNRTNRGNTGLFQSRLKGPFKRYGSATSTSKPTTKQANQIIPGNQGNKWVRAKSEQSGNSVRNISKSTAPQKPVLERQKSIEKEIPEKEIPEKDIIERVDVKTTLPISRNSVSDAKATKLTTGKEDGEKEISVIKEEDIKPVHQKPTSKVPVTSPDTLDTISIGSINSDDLMLDIDLEEYEELGSPPTMEPSRHSRTRSRSRSRSRENPHRKPLGGTVEKSADKCPGSKEPSDSGITTTSPQSKLACMEPLKELATLVQVNNTSISSTQRRQQRRATRPASFPGPRSDSQHAADASHGGSTILKPPRQGSVCADDDDMITIDGFTYRHLVQDVTNFKTMLLKLKRVIQEDEFHGQNWKNGFKLSSSQPTSPYDDSNKYSFAAFLEQDEELQNNSNIDDVIKENAELKLQLQGVRHQMEEQERTIMLLQQQMTKYECGYSEPGGKAYSHVATQTDKVSGFYKAGSYRSACVRRSSSTSSQPLNRYGNRTEFREKSRNSITDEVFMDTESLDNEDDLDLLMEEVSLGSFCLSSVGDNASQCGERSMSLTSAQQRETSFSREPSLTTRDHVCSSQQDSSHMDMSANHDGTTLSHKDTETHPGLTPSSMISVEHTQSRHQKQTIHSHGVESVEHQDLVGDDNKEANAVSVKSYDRTNLDSVANPESVECNDILLSEVCNLPSVSNQRGISVQNNTCLQSTMIASHLPKDSEVCSFKQSSSNSNQSELVSKSGSSVGQLVAKVSKCGDQKNVKQQQSAENNNSLLMKAKLEGNNYTVDNTQKHQLKKQPHFEELEAAEVTDIQQSLEPETKITVKSIKLPSGRITNWSNPRPSFSSGIRPPRPSKPPPKPVPVKQSQSVDGTKFSLHTQSYAKVTDAPAKDGISEQTQKPSRLADNARKHRQLPSLTSVQYSVTNLAGQSHASRLPRMSSGDNIGAAHVGSHSRSQPALRGRAK